MHTNSLDASVKRSIDTCNYNRHIDDIHPDRIMSEHDLIYIREGEWEIAQEDIVYTVHPGDVLFLHGGYHHYGTKPCKSVVSTYFIHFSPNEKDRLCQEADRSADSWCFPTVVHAQEHPMVEHYFKRVLHTYWSKEEYSRQKAAAYLDLLLCELSEAGNTAQRRIPMVESIKQTVQKTPNRFIPIEEFAKEYCCSARTVSAKFKQATGDSLHAWQIKQKCRMAEELMQADPSITLKELAVIYGFYDEYHFGKCFKKVMGRSPKKAK